ncbi:AMP-dependent synthetase/ligase [Streptomyces chumphonensis]|uniref:Acyl-CoA synthetase n=1 Tax=Streptomyces chumphonensis TaxID=1214925 RepID=A0A927F1T2_9ACTN|nr:AMP-dependent synthetase/ligase [Streptomyces chumphonensis]MBD3934030.1 long-chain fatty acid--CoA ligase [Streptomyces chumphonensis]
MSAQNSAAPQTAAARTAVPGAGQPVPQRPQGPPVLVPPLLRRARDGVVRQAEVPPIVTFPRHGSLADIPFTNAAEDPDAVVLARRRPGGGWDDVTCAEFADQVRAVARGLIASGMRPGDRLAIMAPTCFEWTLLDFAAWAVGLITVPVYPTSSAAQVRWILQDAGVTGIAVQDVEGARLVSGIRGALPWLRHLWQFNNGALDQLAAAGRPLPDALVTERRSALGPDNVATLIYTSGTTGRPKGCVLTHGNFMSETDNAVELLHPVFQAVSAEPASTILFLPLAHVFGRMVAIGCLRARVRLGHAPSTDTDALIADFAAFRPTFLLAIPYVLEKIHNRARATAEEMRRGSSFDRAEKVAVRYGETSTAALTGAGRGPGLGLRAARGLYDALVYRRIRAALGGHVRYVISGGSPLGRRLTAFFAGAGIEVYEGYGLTETTAAVTCTPPLKPKLGTVGWPMPGTSVRIAADGEILLKGGSVFGGYWDAERQSVIPETDAQGWLATGDVGALDDEGYLTITGRKKDLIITSGGKNIAPAPLEDWLRAHPLISQCLVIGDNRNYLTALVTLERDGLGHWRRMHGKEDLPMRDLVRDSDLRHAVQQAVNEANQLVSHAEAIRRFTILPGDFTEAAGHLTPSLKIRRDAIVRDFHREIEALYGPTHPDAA